MTVFDEAGGRDILLEGTRENLACDKRVGGACIEMTVLPVCMDYVF